MRKPRLSTGTELARAAAEEGAVTDVPSVACRFDLLAVGERHSAAAKDAVDECSKIAGESVEVVTKQSKHWQTGDLTPWRERWLLLHANRLVWLVEDRVVADEVDDLTGRAVVRLEECGKRDPAEPVL